MISLAVVAGVVVYVYASGLMGPLQGGKVQQPYIEKITLDYYQWSINSTGGTLLLMLRNTGSAQLTLANPCCFIAGQPTNSTNKCGSGLNVNAAACQVTIYTGPTFTQGMSYNVRVVTSDGAGDVAIFDFSCVAGATS
jgi:hypothetical protein